MIGVGRVPPDAELALQAVWASPISLGEDDVLLGVAIPTSVG
jgi:hypothetical protein